MTLLRCTLKGNHYGQTIMNVAHFVDKQPGDALYLQNAALAMEAFIDAMRPAFTQQVVYTQITVDDITAGPLGPFFTKNINKAGAGNNDFASQLNVAWVLKFDTGIAGKKNRGRMYVPGMSPGFTTSGIINPTGIAQWDGPLTNLRLNFLNQSNACRFALCIHGRHDGGDVQTFVTSIQLRTTPGSMRRRMVGVGV